MTRKFLSYAAPTLAVITFPIVFACSDNGSTPSATGGQATAASGAATSGSSFGGQPTAGSSSNGGSAGDNTAGTPAAGGAGGGSGGGSAASGASGSATAGDGAGGGGGAGGGAGGAAGGTGGVAAGGSAQGGVGGTHNGPTTAMGAYLRTGWTAVYTCTGTCPPKNSVDMKDTEPNAFDGSNGTRWSTGVYQDKMQDVFPLYFTVDMKQVNSISKLTFYAGGDPYDAPGQMDVLVSSDGTNFTTVLSAYKTKAPSMGGTETVMLPEGTVGQFIKLKGTMTIHQIDSKLGDRYWAIGEMNVYP